MESKISELVEFLQNDNRIELQSLALSNVLGLTSDKNAGIDLIISSSKLLETLVKLTTNASYVIARDACFVLINLTTNESASEAILKSCELNNQDLFRIICSYVLDANSQLADPLLSILSNLSRNEKFGQRIMNTLLEIDNAIFEKMVSVFSKTDFNQKNQNLHYLAAVFSNLSQLMTFRNLMATSQTRLFQRLLPFINHETSVIRRGGITGLLKNICFDSSLHDWLLSSDVDVLPFILLPLAGPEELDDETNEMLPLELQYLEPEKKREEDSDIRTILLESLAQLCATRKGRTYLRSKGTYEILRELHKFEISSDGDMKALSACENVVDILIRTEDEIVHDNLKQVDIPEDVIEKIEKMIDE